MSVFEVSVGVVAYNEEKNIGRLLEGLLAQKTVSCRIREILVVSDASTDKTDEIVQGFGDSRVRLVRKPVRGGKASGINVFMKEASCDLLVLSSGDLVVEEDAIEELVKPFADGDVAMTGAHPVPLNSPDSVFGFLSHLTWHFHHMHGLESPTHPKLGEMIAFRKIFGGIYEKTGVDEDEIQGMIVARGLKQVYCPDAIVYNHGPANLKDYMKQRVRVKSGHRELERRTGYIIPKWSIASKIRWAKPIIGYSPKKLLWALTGFLLENTILSTAFVQGRLRGINPYMWDSPQSTKFKA
ncbi:MAG: glycosyltransferase [Candidatus Altiarchaeota archaeon]